MAVVVGTDGSERAERAVVKATNIAAALDQELVIVCAPSEGFSEGISVGDHPEGLSAGEWAEWIARQAAQRAKETHPTLRVATRVEAGKPAEALLRVAEDTSAEVIVVGNKRVQGISRVLGSIARDIAAHANCDLYVVHTNE